MSLRVLVVGLIPAAHALVNTLKTGLKGSDVVVNPTIPANFRPRRPPANVDVVVFAGHDKATLGVASEMTAGPTRYIHVDDETQLPADFNRGPFGGIFFANKGDTATLIKELSSLVAFA